VARRRVGAIALFVTGVFAPPATLAFEPPCAETLPMSKAREQARRTALKELCTLPIVGKRDRLRHTIAERAAAHSALFARLTEALWRPRSESGVRLEVDPGDERVLIAYHVNF
jgi:hypothetical protein